MPNKQKFGLREFAQAHGLSLGKDCCFGIYAGYRVHVKYRAFGNPACLLTVVSNTAGKNKELEKYLEHHKKELKLFGFGVIGIGLMVSPHIYTQVFRQIEEILDKLTEYLKKNHFPGADVCPYCGKPLGDDRTEMLESGIPFAAHEACFMNAYASARQKEEAQRMRPDRRLAGMAGAILGGLAGVAVFFVMFLWWEFGAIAALLGTVLGGWLYQKFGGKNTIFRIVFVSASSLVLLLLAYALCLYMQAPPAETVTDVVSSIVQRLRDKVGFRVLFVLNLVLLFVFDAVGTVFNILSYRRERVQIYRLVRRANLSEGLSC